MNSLSIQTQQTMSSVEIAELTGKEHKHVKRDIDVIIEQLKISPNLDTSFRAANYKDSYGRNQPCYQLDYKATMIVLTGYDVVARSKVIERWQELEQQAIKPIDPMQVLNDPAAMRGLLLTYAETVIEKDKVIAEKDEVIAEQAPKVAALNLLSGSEGSLNVTESAKALGIQPSKLFLWLQTNGWIYRRAGNKNWLGYQAKVQVGYLTHKVRPILLQDGTERIEEQVRIMPKGLTKLAKVFSVGEATGGTAHA